MELIDQTGNSKIAARIRNAAARIKNNVIVIISEHCPESILLTGFLPRTKGWRQLTIFPIRKNGRKDYVRIIMETKEKELWIKVSTSGGRSKIYVR